MPRSADGRIEWPSRPPRATTLVRRPERTVTGQMLLPKSFGLRLCQNQVAEQTELKAGQAACDNQTHPPILEMQGHQDSQDDDRCHELDSNQERGLTTRNAQQRRGHRVLLQVGQMVLKLDQQ